MILYYTGRVMRLCTKIADCFASENKRIEKDLYDRKEQSIGDNTLRENL